MNRSKPAIDMYAVAPWLAPALSDLHPAQGAVVKEPVLAAVMSETAAQAVPADDPEPVPPTPPGPNECCQSGCIPCVYDMYNDEMETYREALRAWRARHPESS